MTALPRAFVLGAHRSGGLKLLPLLSPHLDVIGIGAPAFLEKPFPSKLLESTLRSFHPPVQVLTLGGAFKDEDESAARAVWDAYREEVSGEKGEENYGQEKESWTGVVRTTSAEITQIKAELGIEGYEAVGKAIVRNLEKREAAAGLRSA